MLRVVVETAILNIPIVLRIHPCPSRRSSPFIFLLGNVLHNRFNIQWRMSRILHGG